MSIMSNIKWYFNRLKSMNLLEVIWRVNQKFLEKREYNNFKNKKEIINSFFNDKLSGLNIDIDKLSLNLNNQEYTLNKTIKLLGNYDYKDFKNKWHAGFQTDNNWPKIFSYNLKYKQRDDIGDARCNWELNRHYQFAILAKNYFVTKDKSYLEELEYLFYDWNKENPFLYGISYTSVMEIAIRCNNWCYMYYFLKHSNVNTNFLKDIETGIINMADYITKHYSKFSSSNNHLIVEMYVIGQCGILFDYKPWIDLSIRILDKELFRQNYIDGINKEMSLHYHAFVLETYGLMVRLLKKNSITIPSKWLTLLDKMIMYLYNSIGKYNEVIEFGDNDEGKILDLDGDIDYYEYVLGLFSYLLENNYSNKSDENLNWLFNKNEKNNKKIVSKDKNICYKHGGVTILRNDKNDILIGIDHGELGFGSIAAHGHADALSFQMFVKGVPLLIDPGTYIYHVDIDSRNYYRRTINHNTVSIDGKDQSTMLGAFLWGRRAKTKLIDYKSNENIYIKAKHNGYKPVIHTREFIFNNKDKLEIIDSFNKECKKYINFNFGESVRISKNNNKIYFKSDKFSGIMIIECMDKFNLSIDKKKYSKQYAIETTINSLILKTNSNYIKTTIVIKEKYNDKCIKKNI